MSSQQILLDAVARQGLAVRTAIATRTAPNSDKLGGQSLAAVLNAAHVDAADQIAVATYDLTDGFDLSDIIDEALANVENANGGATDIRTVNTVVDLPAVGSTIALYIVKSPVSLYWWNGYEYVNLTETGGTSLTDTDGLAEGAVNKYFTVARAIAAIGSTDNVAEGVTNQYFTRDRVLSVINSTDMVAEGTLNKYFTDARVMAAIGFTPENPANKGVANGYAPLNGQNQIPSIHLPSYVDDVLEFATYASFPGTGESGKIYSAVDTNKIYRWSGSGYVEISASPGSTDAVPEGATNKYFTNARALAAITSTDVLTEGTTKLFFTNARALAAISSTDVVPEGSTNKYFTNARVMTAIGYTPENPANKGTANGYADLDATGKVPLTRLGNVLAAANVWSSKQTFGAAVNEKFLAVGASNIDVATANHFSKTISANTVFTVSNAPAAGEVCSFALHLTNGGSFTVTWWNNIKWAGGTAPTLTASGRDIIAFSTLDGGATWDGYLLGKDMK